jgi:rod shape-determining protein MreD
MSRYIIWSLMIVVAALVQTTWVDAISIYGAHPELVLLLVVYFAVADGEEWAMWTGAIGGLFTDVAMSARLGHNMLCYVVLGFVLGRICRRLITDSPAVKVSLVFLGALFKGILWVFLYNIMNPGFGATAQFFNQSIPTAFYTAVAAPPVFFLLDRRFKRRYISANGLS